MNNELQNTSQAHELTNYEPTLQSAGHRFDKSDLRISKLTLIQKMTRESFNPEEVKVGNFIDSIEKYDMGNEFEVFVFDCVKLWKWSVNVKKGNDINKEYVTITDFVDSPDARQDFKTNLPARVKDRLDHLDFTQEQLIAPDLVYRFSVVLVSEVEQGIAFPYNIDFTRSSAGEGNRLQNIFYRLLKVTGKHSFEKVFKIKSAQETKDDYTFYVLKASAGRDASEEEKAAVVTWARELQNNSSKYTVDESDTSSEETDTQTFETSATTSEEAPKF